MHEEGITVKACRRKAQSLRNLDLLGDFSWVPDTGIKWASLLMNAYRGDFHQEVWMSSS